MGEVADIVSLKYGSKDGLAFCGGRVYEIQSQTSSSYLDLIDKTL